MLPLLASILLVCGLIFIKRADGAGGPVTVLFLANMISAVIFSLLWTLGGTMQPLTLLWQPFVIAILFSLGLTFTFLAIEQGDVSIATPVLGVKVIIVAMILTVFVGEALPSTVWWAAVLAVLGIGIIQWTGNAHPKRAVFTVTFALLAATSFACFDALVQQWAPAWGAGRFLPIVYWMVGLLSLTMIPWVDFSVLRNPRLRRLILPGAALIALQAICITFAVANFGDAARINVVYALRGLWSVLFAWIAAKIWGGAEAELDSVGLVTRLVGAVLLTAAVVLVVTS